MEFVTSSDLTAALVGAGFSEAYGGPGSPAMLAAKSFVIRLVNRPRCRPLSLFSTEIRRISLSWEL